MKALIWNSSQKLTLEEREQPIIKTQNDVKIKIKYTGICGTDLQVIKGNENVVSNIILGHEAVGEIVEKGDNVTEYRIGDDVIVDPNQYCCDCENCKKGLTNFCTGWNGGLKIAGINIDGTFAEYYSCHKRYIYKVPHEMSLEEAVLIEPLACVLNNIRSANIKENESVLVIGSGPMGILCQMIARNKAGLIVAVENSEYRKKQSTKFCDYVFCSSEINVETIKKINKGRLFDVIIDTVGTQLEAALYLCGKKGRIIPIGMNKIYSYKINPYYLIVNGIKLIGASEYNMLFSDTLDMTRRFKRLDEIITGKYLLSNYKQAFNNILGYDIDTGEKKEISQMKVIFEL